jgi:hypothetical protein
MSPNAPLSIGEMNALRRVGSGLAKFLPSAHRMRLASLGLIAVISSGRLVLTQGGKEQLAEREVTRPCRAIAMTSPEKPVLKHRWSILILTVVGAMAIIATISEQSSKDRLQASALAASER